MPPPGAHCKSSKLAPSAVERIESRRQRLQRGISALQVAFDCLPLTGQQRVLVQSLIRDQEKLLALVESTQPASPKSGKTLLKSKPNKNEPKQPTPKPIKTPLSPEELARKTLDGQVKKQERVDRDKRVRMIEAQRRAEIEATHRKSGYTTFMLRAPGSFGGGKK